MTKADKLLNRLRSELGMKIPKDAVIKRTYAGRILLAGGAFKWMVVSKNICTDIGSSDTVTELLKAPKLAVMGYWGDNEIVIDE